jgi:hypothetical protein
MQNKTLIVLIAAAIVGASSTAMAKGGGGGGGKGGWSHGGMSMRGHGQFDHRFRFVNRFNRNQFLRNQALLNGWGWGDWGWGGWPYSDNGYGNNTVIVLPQARPQAATGTTATDPCHLTADTFNVPSAVGGTRAVQVVACR